MAHFKDQSVRKMQKQMQPFFYIWPYEKVFYSITQWLELVQVRKIQNRILFSLENNSNLLISLDGTNCLCIVMMEKGGVEYTLTGATITAEVELQSQLCSHHEVQPISSINSAKKCYVKKSGEHHETAPELS